MFMMWCHSGIVCTRGVDLIAAESIAWMDREWVFMYIKNCSLLARLQIPYGSTALAVELMRRR
jgi:hypothetical protein